VCCSVTHITHGCGRRKLQDSFLRAINYKKWNKTVDQLTAADTLALCSALFIWSQQSEYYIYIYIKLPENGHKSVAIWWHGFFRKSFYNSIINLHLTTFRPVEWRRKPSITLTTINAELVHCTYSMLNVHPHYQQITMKIGAKIKYITSSSGNALL